MESLDEKSSCFWDLDPTLAVSPVLDQSTGHTAGPWVPFTLCAGGQWLQRASLSRLVGHGSASVQSSSI